MDVILNIQKKLNFYALQLFYFSSSLGEKPKPKQSFRAFAFWSKNKKNQKRKIIVFFCLLSTSLAFFFCFKWRKRILCFFFTDDAPFRFFLASKSGSIFCGCNCRNLIWRIKKKEKKVENVCPSRSIWYLGIHIFLKMKKTYKQKKNTFSKKCCFLFFWGGIVLI